MFGVCILHDVTRLTSPKSKLTQCAYWLKNLIFTSLAAPIAMVSTIPTTFLKVTITVMNMALTRGVLSVSKILIASIFSNHCNFKTKRDTSDMFEVRSLDL